MNQTTFKQEFVPKDRNERWRLVLAADTSAGYDYMLLVENPATKVSYLVEFGIMEDGRFCGQITPDQGDNGPDPLVLFDMSHEIARVSGNGAGMQLIVDRNKTEPTVVPLGYKPPGYGGSTTP